MTEAAAALQPPESFQLAQAWAESMAQVLGQVSGSPFSCAALTEIPAGLTLPGESDLWIVCVYSGGLRGEMSLRLPPASTLSLAQIMMGQPFAPEAELMSHHREAAVELLRQVAGLVTTAIKPKWNDVQLRLDPAAGAPSWPTASTWWLRAGENPSSTALVEIQLSAALVAALRIEKTEPEHPVVNAVATVSPGSPDGAGKLDLLMDVELAVTLRFGSRRLLLSELLDLTPGAVIELDRQVGDPVDMLLGGRLLARGEVVVVGGNFGLRVSEVAPA